MKLILWFTVLTLGTAGIWLLWGGQWSEQLSFEGSVKWLEGTGDWAWAAGFGLLTVDILLPIPGTVVATALGHIYGTVLGGLISAAGLTSAGLLGYGAGRCFGARFAKRWLGEKDFRRGEKLFTGGGGWIVALSRALPVLPEVVSCTAGLVGMPFPRFLLALVCGSVPMGLVFAAIGSAGKEAPGWVIALNLLIPAVLWLIASKIKGRDKKP